MELIHMQGLTVLKWLSQKEKNIMCIYVYGIYKNGTDEPICKEGMETQMQRMDLWTQQGKGRAGRIERVVLTFVYHHVWNRQLAGSCCVTRGAQPGSLYIKGELWLTSCCCMAETNTTLWSYYPPIKKFKKMIKWVGLVIKGQDWCLLLSMCVKVK